MILSKNILLWGSRGREFESRRSDRVKALQGNTCKAFIMEEFPETGTSLGHNLERFSAI